MSNSIKLSSVAVNANGYQYICDFDVFFEPVNPDAELWGPNGQDLPDLAQDVVVFYFVQINRAFNLELDSNLIPEDNIDEWVNLSDALLDWCNTEDSLHIEAFKQYKNAE